MTVYIVTSGEYSEYSIERVFSNKKAAEDYIEWRRPSSYRIEEYDMLDDGKDIDMEGQAKYYYIEVRGICYKEAVVNITYNIERTITSNRPDITRPRTGVWEYKPKEESFRLNVRRWIPAENWDEDFHKNKYTKVFYDTAAAVRAMMADGANWIDIKNYFEENCFDEYPAD